MKNDFFYKYLSFYFNLEIYILYFSKSYANKKAKVIF